MCTFWMFRSASLRFFNVLGQLVYSSDNVETTINVSALTAGQYIVRAIDENGMIETVKFIKK